MYIHKYTYFVVDIVTKFDLSTHSIMLEWLILFLLIDRIQQY